MMACSGVVWSRTIQSGLRSFGTSFPLGGPETALEKRCPVIFAPRLKDEDYDEAQMHALKVSTLPA